MGVGGLWEFLRPVARKESLVSLRGKKVAIDLSYWIVQQQTAVKGHARKPHLRLLFFRTINLVVKIGVLPVFVVDGDPPPLKLQTRLERFSRMSGVPSNLHAEVASLLSDNVARNSVFTQNVEECVELLKLLGVPVLRAKYEAEALCAELDREGFVNACVTPDSDAFLYGARCVIKHLQADFNEPLVESYMSADIESVFGLHREHLVALALLAGCDYNVQGVSGIGCNNAAQLIRSIPKQEILNRLREWGEGKLSHLADMEQSNNIVAKIEERNREVAKDSLGKKSPHCSCCGHPGTKKLHAKLGCKHCSLAENEDSEQGCRPKAQGFRCTCEICIKEHDRKKHVKHKAWNLKFCGRIAATRGFPNEQIIQIYLNSQSSSLSENKQELSSLSLYAPQMDGLESFLSDHLYWNQIYVRQKVLPLLSQLCLQQLACMTEARHVMLPSSKGLINGLYAPHSIERIKIFYTKLLYRLRWEQVVSTSPDEDWLGLKHIQFHKKNEINDIKSSFGLEETGIGFTTEPVDCHVYFTTDEDIALVREACPELVEAFEQEQDAKSKRKKKSTKRKKEQLTSATNKQLSITSFFKSTKGSIEMVDTFKDTFKEEVFTAAEGAHVKTNISEVITIKDVDTVNTELCCAIDGEDLEDSSMMAAHHYIEEGFTPPPVGSRASNVDRTVIVIDPATKTASGPTQFTTKRRLF